MAKKSKRTSRKRSRPHAQRRFAGLQRKVAEGPLGGSQIVFEPRGVQKMSEVLERFVGPYLDAAEDEESLRKLFAVAIVAWNAALLPASEREKTINDLTKSAFKGIPAQFRQDFRDILNELIERKLKRFGKYTRFIIDYDLTVTHQGFYLSVASTLDPSEVK